MILPWSSISGPAFSSYYYHYAIILKAYYYVAHYVWPYHETVRMSVCPSVCPSVCLSVCHVSYLENGASYNGALYRSRV